VRSGRSAHVVNLPAITWSHSTSGPTRSGLGIGLRKSPRPTWPIMLSPQHDSLRFTSSAHACCFPEAIWIHGSVVDTVSRTGTSWLVPTAAAPIPICPSSFWPQHHASSALSNAQ
jgi:hypothetical protein